MHSDETLKRFNRIVALLTQLQSKKVVKAADMAKRFDVSLRTIYRDIRTLEAAGVPIYSEAGIGYSLLDGYRLPPVMFTKEEAGSFIAAERLMQRFTDDVFKKNFQSAVFKIKAVLQSQEKEWLESLESRVRISERDIPFTAPSPEVLSILFDSIAHQKQVKMRYFSLESDEPNERVIEPIVVYHEFAHWYLSAYCHLRKDYRFFRIDRILEIEQTEQPFELEHQEPEFFIKKPEPKSNAQPLIRILMHRKVARYMENERFYYGFVKEIPRKEGVELHFRCDFKKYGMARWFLPYADCGEILEPQEFKDEVKKLAKAIQERLGE